MNWKRAGLARLTAKLLAGCVYLTVSERSSDYSKLCHDERKVCTSIDTMKLGKI